MCSYFTPVVSSKSSLSTCEPDGSSNFGKLKLTACVLGLGSMREAAASKAKKKRWKKGSWQNLNMTLWSELLDRVKIVPFQRNAGPVYSVSVLLLMSHPPSPLLDICLRSVLLNSRLISQWKHSLPSSLNTLLFPSTNLKPATPSTPQHTTLAGPGWRSRGSSF